MDLSSLTFVKRQRCGGCDEPLMPGENWGCAHAWIPIHGFSEMVVELHQHVHIRCATGHVKFLALSTLGRARVECN